MSLDTKSLQKNPVYYQISAHEARTQQPWKNMKFDNPRFHELPIEERNKFGNWHALLEVGKKEDLPEIPTEVHNMPYEVWHSLTQTTQEVFENVRASKFNMPLQITNNAMIALVASYTLQYGGVSQEKIASIFGYTIDNTRKRLSVLSDKFSTTITSQRPIVKTGYGKKSNYSINWNKIAGLPKEYLSAEVIKHIPSEQKL